MRIRLRDVELRDLAAYLAMRCDPVMMAELGGPLPAEGMAAKVERDVAEAASDRSWIKMIEVDGGTAGTVALWSHQDSPQDSHASRGNDGALVSEIGWMVLPRYQGRGLAKLAVRELIDRAADDGRWGAVHAFPAVTNGPSNGICRSTGFTLRGERRVEFAERLIHTNHWVHPAG
ncbi:RimJ/RimL family protein N-acetyltransferase [Kitasatospora acidiphila]